MNDYKQTLLSIRESYEQGKIEEALNKCLKCSLSLFEKAKKEQETDRERFFKHGKTLMALYESIKETLDKNSHVSELSVSVSEKILAEKIDLDATQIMDEINQELSHCIQEETEPKNTNEQTTSIIQKNNVSLRPQMLSDYIGQSKIVAHLRMLIDASNERNDALDHILLYGSAGLGKTSLAHIISREMKSKFIELNATTLTDLQSFANIIKSLEFKDILFIDEVHALSSSISDMLLTVLEDYKLSYIKGKNANAKVVNDNVNKFTFIGATTHPGMLSKPLLDRMITKFKMERYTFDELSLLIKKSCSKWQIEIDDDASMEISKRSRYVPRIANNFVRTFRDIAQINKTNHLTKELVLKYFSEQQIDEEGITNEDRRILITMLDRFNGGPVSLMSIASVVGDNENIIEYQIEPYLVQKGFITITKAGRVCTDEGIKYINEYRMGEVHESE